VFRAASAKRPTTSAGCTLGPGLPSVHKYHEKALIAFQPIALTQDKKQLTIKLWWLPRFIRSANVSLTDSPNIPTGMGYRQGEKHKTVLVNVDTGERISSGDEIHLSTTDPEALPLPNFQILEMQWVLQCVAAMSAAAEPQDQPYHEDDDDFYDLPVAASESIVTSPETQRSFLTSSPISSSTIPSSNMPSSPWAPKNVLPVRAEAGVDLLSSQCYLEP
jgi:hypothetical protein